MFACLHEADVHMAKRHLAIILNTDLLIAPCIRLRHTSVKMARLTNFDRKDVQIFLTNKPLTLQM